MLAEYQRRAAKWFADQNMPGKAIEYALSCHAYEEAADWMEPEVQKAIVGGEFSTIIRWVDALPEDAMNVHPNLRLAMTWAILIRDPIRFWSNVELNMDRLYGAFGLVGADLRNALERLEPGSEGRIRLCELALMQAFVSRQYGELEDAVGLFNLVLRMLPAEAYFQRGVGLAGLGSTYLRTGAAKLAEQAFGQAAEVSGQAGSLYGEVVSLAFQALMQGWQGRLRQAAATYRRAIDLVPEDEAVFLPLSGMPWVGLGDILREQNHLQTARQLLEQGIKRGIQTGDIDALRDGYVILSRINLAIGDEAGAGEAMSDAEGIARETGSSECINEAAAWRARIDMMGGNIEGAVDWAIRRGIRAGEATQPEEPLVEVEQLTLARLLMNQGKYSQALDLIQPLLEKFESNERDQAVIEATVLKSLCLFKSGHREQAVDDLAGALRLAEGEGYVRLFLDEGPVMAALLRSAGAEGHSSDYAGHLLNEFGGDASQQALPDPLSERELEVVELIYRGLNNQQIADELTIALSTVKTHVNRIYSKLGVKNRSQAMARVRELRLLA